MPRGTDLLDEKGLESRTCLTRKLNGAKYLRDCVRRIGTGFKWMIQLSFRKVAVPF